MNPLLPSEISAYRPPSPSEFPVTFHGGGMDIFWNHTLCRHVVLSFESLDEILWCDHSNEISLAVLLHGAFCFAGFKIRKFSIFLNFYFSKC